MTGRTGSAALAGLAYSTFSPSVIFPLVRHDIANPLWPRRLQTLTAYGEGPHVLAMMLLPLAVLFFHRAVTRRLRLSALPASLLISAILLINWTGTVGLTLALLAYMLAFGSRQTHWAGVLAIAMLAYGLACPWIPPSAVRTAIVAAQHANGSYPFTWDHLLMLFLIVPAVFFLHSALRRFGTPVFTRFAILFAVFTSLIFVAGVSFGFALLPQPHRWHLEFEIGIIVAVTLTLASRAASWPSHRRRVALSVFLLLCGVQLYIYRDHGKGEVYAIDVRDTSEYKVAQWFQEHMRGERVFAPGSIALWMNAFTDVPQFLGCCDQGMANAVIRGALHTIYTGENAGPRDGGNSALWLKVFGVQAVAVSSAPGTERYKPFRNPAKFDGILPVLWREGGDIIYRAPQRSPSLAHVIPRSALVARAPAHGLDTDPLVAYAAALDDPTLPLAALRWTSRHSARVSTTIEAANQVISIQEDYVPGWKASVDGAARRVSSDGLGMIVIEPECMGTCSFELIYDNGLESDLCRLVQALSIFGFVVYLWRCFARSHPVRVD